MLLCGLLSVDRVDQGDHLMHVGPKPEHVETNAGGPIENESHADGVTFANVRCLLAEDRGEHTGADQG